MDKMSYFEKTSSTQRPRLDRFVEPRSSIQELEQRFYFKKPHIDGEIWDTKNIKQKKYINHFNKVFDLKPTTQKSKDAELRKSLDQIWPCKPRKKSCLALAGSIIDLPDYTYTVYKDLLDWSKDNIVVIAVGTEFQQYCWKTQSHISHGVTAQEIICCKYDPMGEFLSLGTKRRCVELHDYARNERLVSINCQCLHEHLAMCSITALEWSPTGTSFVTGCSRGMLTAITRQFEVIRYRRVFMETIFAVKVSPDARVVAVAGVFVKKVVLLCWPELEPYTTFVDNAILTLTWHPWRSALLAVGTLDDNMRSSITLWHTPSGRRRKSNLGHDAHCMENMLFSHRTGELVVSAWKSDITDPEKCTRLVVLSDPDTAVDQWGNGRLDTGMPRIGTMVFSPDGTKLAMATTNEDLMFLDFLPKDKSKEKKNRKRYYLMPEYLDMTTSGFCLR